MLGQGLPGTVVAALADPGRSGPPVCLVGSYSTVAVWDTALASTATAWPLGQDVLCHRLRVVAR